MTHAKCRCLGSVGKFRLIVECDRDIYPVIWRLNKENEAKYEIFLDSFEEIFGSMSVLNTVATFYDFPITWIVEQLLNESNLETVHVVPKARIIFGISYYLRQK